MKPITPAPYSIRRAAYAWRDSGKCVDCGGTATHAYPVRDRFRCMPCVEKFDGFRSSIAVRTDVETVRAAVVP